MFYYFRVMRWIWILGLLSILSCSKKAEIELYIQNVSHSDSVAIIEVEIDNKVEIIDTLRYVNVSPAYTGHLISTENGKHQISIKNLKSGAIYTDTILVDSKKYLFVEYQYRIKSSFAKEMELFKHISLGYDSSTFVFDSIGVQPSFIVMEYDTPIVVY